MPYEYFEVTAEMGIRAWANSLNEVFVESARALFGLMIDIQAVQPIRSSQQIVLESTTLETLLADWLNQLIVERDRAGLVFSQFEVRLFQVNQAWQLTGCAMGEVFDRSRHDPRSDIKAVTYNNLACEARDNFYFAECVLDI
jgi:SHS2 domain-containing protein